MRWLNMLQMRFRSFFRRGNESRRLDDELRFHIDHQISENIAAGMPADEARYAALRAFGNPALLREQSRATWSWNWLESFLSDAHYSARMMIRNPGFVAIAVGSLALGIGANTAIFSMTKSMLLDSIPVFHPEELRLLEWQVLGQTGYRNLPMESLYGDVDFSKTGTATGASFSYPVYQALRQNNIVFDDVAAYFHAGHVEIAVDGEGDPGTVEYVSGNFFRMLGTRTAAGRNILSADDIAGASPVAVISDFFWSEHFGRAQNAIGKTIELNRIPVTIVGIAPSSFHGAEVDADPLVYIPLAMQPMLSPEESKNGKSSLTDGDRWWVHILGRTKSGVTDIQAQEALDAIFRLTAKATLIHAQRVDDESVHLVLAPGNYAHQRERDTFLPIAYVLSALVALVLLLACLNLANLLLARAAARQRELSVRLALGAQRGRILRQLLTESMLLAMMGGLVGTLLGYAGRNLIPHLLEEQPPRFDWKVLGFALSLSLLTGLLFGLIPAWRVARADMQTGLRNTGHMTAQRSHTFLGRSLVAVQICFSMVLLIGMGLFAGTLRNLLHTQLGFEPHHLLLFNLELPKTQYPKPETRSAGYQQIQDRLSTLPGVQSVSFSGVPLIDGGPSTTNFDPDGSQPGRIAWMNVVGTRFFQTMGIPLLAGRDFGRQDTAASEKVAVVNEQLVRQFFPKQNPIGRVFNSSHIRIIGICSNTKFSSLRQNPPPTYYLLGRQNDWDGFTFEVKATGNPAALVASARDAVHAFDQELPLMHIRTQEEQIDGSLREERLFAFLTTAFGALALVLACIGIYGIMAYNVSRRVNEIGIRMALGAQAGQVLRMVMGDGAWLAVIGIAAGLGGALALGRLISSMLFGLKTYDPATLFSAAMLLMLVTLAASWLPAHRAASIDPMRALRTE